MTDLPFDAVIFDLDGVITRTALVHSRAWKQMFDEYLHHREKIHGEAFREFSHQHDYLPYVDGKPRYKGVQSFLESRGIDIPFGDPDDKPGMETVCGIGNRKNEVFNRVLRDEGVQVYPSTVALMKTLREKGIRVGVASSSKNCEQVLEAAGLSGLAETRIDGVVSAELGLKGKPEADIFTTAADRLGVPYDRSVVVEDAVSGVQAGKNGNFGLVLGIAREGNSNELLEGGADVVVNDIDEIGYEGICRWFDEGLPRDNWELVYHGYDPGLEKTRETLLTTGNGYFGTRGAPEEASAGDVHYPATYMAGLFNRLSSKVGGREIENEDFVNVTNYLPLTFRIDGGEWLEAGKTAVLSVHRRLQMDKGILSREMIVRDGQGRETMVQSERFASMDDPRLAVVRYNVTPLNYAGTIEIRTGLTAGHINDGVERYRSLNQKHLEALQAGAEGNLQFLEAKTTQSGIIIGMASRIMAEKGNTLLQATPEHHTGKDFVYSSIRAALTQNEPLGIMKTTTIFRSGDGSSHDPLKSAVEKAKRADDHASLRARSLAAWKAIWDKADIQLEGDRLAQKLLRLHIYHLMVTISPHNKHIDAGIPARGLHGEAYRGHIFWDEIFILPFYFMHFPEAARSVLMYRYRRLEAAREYARLNGESGAMFPWQSGSDGREETQVIHLNPVSGEWGPDHSSLQRHVSLAIAYNIIMYGHYTKDGQFMNEYGAEMLIGICRFWANKAKKDEKGDRYNIEGVMGPDEFHEKYAGADEGGLRNNAYTNLMCAWMLRKTLGIINSMEEKPKQAVISKTGLTEGETEKWKDVSEKLNLVISDDGIIAQFDGYFELDELDWEYYRQKYGNIYRMDRLLKAEGLSPDAFKVAKQADTLMTYYNLNNEDVDELLRSMGYRLPEGYLKKNLEYYLARTSHGSTLSRVVHARLAGMVGNRQLGWKLYMDALTSDYNDIQGGTTAEGIHAGVMAGTVLGAIETYAGLDLRGETVRINPDLPAHWKSVRFKFTFKRVNYLCEVTREGVKLLPETGR
jgi:beta-phosphoglucomutase family hydrolase